MAAFLIRATHGPDFKPPLAIGIFNDVTPDHWSADYIEQLYNDGITTGCVPGVPNDMCYCPEDTVTRSQMAVFVVRALHGFDFVPPPHRDLHRRGHGSTGPPPTSSSSTPTASPPAACRPARAAGVLPRRSVTRAEMAVFLVRAFDIPYLH